MSTLACVEESTNALPLTQSLPVEILQNIFIHCVDHCYYEHLHCVVPYVPCRVNISYVCRYWRNVALKCPTFWAYIFLASQRWTEELLHRSKQASLKISIDFESLPSPSRLLGNLEKVMDHVERIEELHLTQMPTSDVDQVLSKLSSPAPRLRSLTVIHTNPLGPSQPLHPGHTPALCTLQLSWFPVFLQSFTLNALTSLRLDDCVPYEFRQNVKDFLVTLKCMPNLEDLHLSSLLDKTGFPSSAMLTAFEKIDLHHLSRLFFDAPCSTVVAFLSCVNIPLKTNVWLSLYDHTSEDWNPYELLYSFLAERYSVVGDPNFSSPTIHSITLKYLDLPFKLTCSPNKRTSTFFFLDEVWESDCPFQISLDRTMHDIEGALLNVCRSLPLSDVQSLYVFEPEFDSFLTSMLPCLPDVRYINVHRGTMLDFFMLVPQPLEAQNRDELAVDARRPCHVIAPLLEELELEGTIFQLEEGFYPMPFPTTRDQLFNELAERQGSRGRLTMTGCEMDNCMVDLVMEWDDGDCRLVSQSVYELEDDDEVDKAR